MAVPQDPAIPYAKAVTRQEAVNAARRAAPNKSYPIWSLLIGISLIALTIFQFRENEPSSNFLFLAAGVVNIWIGFCGLKAKRP